MIRLEDSTAFGGGVNTDRNAEELVKSEELQAMSRTMGLLSGKPCTKGGGRWHKN